MGGHHRLLLFLPGQAGVSMPQPLLCSSGLVPEPTGQVAETGTLRENPGGEKPHSTPLPPSVTHIAQLLPLPRAVWLCPPPLQGTWPPRENREDAASRSARAGRGCFMALPSPLGMYPSGKVSGSPPCKETPFAGLVIHRSRQHPLMVCGHPGSPSSSSSSYKSISISSLPFLQNCLIFKH